MQLLQHKIQTATELHDKSAIAVNKLSNKFEHQQLQHDQYKSASPSERGLHVIEEAYAQIEKTKKVVRIQLNKMENQFNDLVSENEGVQLHKPK